jgi:hypothetical protein
LERLTLPNWSCIRVNEYHLYESWHLGLQQLCHHLDGSRADRIQKRLIGEGARIIAPQPRKGRACDAKSVATTAKQSDAATADAHAREADAQQPGGGHLQHIGRQKADIEQRQCEQAWQSKRSTLNAQFNDEQKSH